MCSLPFLVAAQILCCRQVGFKHRVFLAKGLRSTVGVWLALPIFWDQTVENIICWEEEAGLEMI